LGRKYNILIIDEAHSSLLDELSEHEVTYAPHCTLDELSQLLVQTQVLVMRSKLTFDKDWIDKAPSLECIGRLGSGMDNIDEQYAQSKGIACFNAPEGNRNAVAEHTIGVLLSLLANIAKSAAEVKHYIWDRKGNEGIELAELTVGVIGYGNVGSQLAKRLKGFGCTILAYDKFKTGFGNEVVEECSLETLQKEADIISIHVPLNQSSKNMINDVFIEQVRKPFYLLNMARGSVVDTKAVVNGLKSGKIRGCGLDVFENEKLETLSTVQREMFDYLANNEKVVFTPHIAGLTKNSYHKLSIVLANKILEWTKTVPLVN
jgi:D-3-phosphoglycerate dehydrogenase